MGEGNQVLTEQPQHAHDWQFWKEHIDVRAEDARSGIELVYGPLELWFYCTCGAAKKVPVQWEETSNQE